MTAAVRIVTDSNSMIPGHLVAALSIIVVPLTVTIGEDELVEDATMDVAAAYGRLRAGEVATTSAPAPGAFLQAYEALGAGPIASVHIGATYSGTVDSARVGARLCASEVVVMDSGCPSFLAGCSVLAAAEAARDGGGLADVVAAAERTAASVRSVFTLTDLERGRAGGRLVVDDDRDGSPVLLMDRSGISVVGRVGTTKDAAELMLDHLQAQRGRMRIGIGGADAGPVVDDLVDRVRALRPDDEVIRYLVGPTVAAHAGMGTFGIVYHPLSERI